MELFRVSLLYPDREEAALRAATVMALVGDIAMAQDLLTKLTSSRDRALAGEARRRLAKLRFRLAVAQIQSTSSESWPENQKLLEQIEALESQRKQTEEELRKANSEGKRYAERMILSPDKKLAALCYSESILEEVASKYGRNALLKAAGQLGAGVVSQASSLFDLCLTLLTLHQDTQTQEYLDQWRESILDRQNRARRRLQGEEVPRLSEENRPPMSESDAEFIRALQHLGVRVRMPGEAVRNGEAQISGRATHGYSGADVQIISRTDDLLALNMNGGYLIPSNANSGSQRLGLVSAIPEGISRIRPPAPKGSAFKDLPGDSEGPSASGFRWCALTSPGVVAKGEEASHEGNSPGAWARGGWVLLEPRAEVVIPFHTVCLDHSRGVPGHGENFYMSDRPLPARIQQILLMGAVNGQVPQSQVWGTIGAENIRWYDPRDDFGTLKIFFTGDSTTYKPLGNTPYELKITVWLDGQPLIQEQRARDQVFSFRVPSGKHVLEMLPATNAPLEDRQVKRRAEIEVSQGETHSYQATFHITVRFLGSQVEISNFRETELEE